MPPTPYSHLSGREFPGGTAAVPAWMNRLWCDAVAATEDTAPHVHPTLVYYAAVQGAGIGFGEIFDLFDGSISDGIMIGGQEFEFREPMQIDREYRAAGAINSVDRKVGRQAGTFDLATIEFQVLTAGSGELVAATTTSFIFPRRGETA